MTALEVAGWADFQARLVQAKSAVAGVAKDGRNSQQGYDYATVEGMLRAVRGPLAEHGINLSVSLVDVHRDAITSGRGAQGERITVTVAFTLRDTKSEAFTTHHWAGVGEDYGDKAIGKAYTSAVKTFIRTEWLLPTGDDPEADKHVPVVDIPEHAQRADSPRLQSAGEAMSAVIGAEPARAMVKNLRELNGSELSIGQVAALYALASAVAAQREAEAILDNARNQEADA